MDIQEVHNWWYSQLPSHIRHTQSHPCVPPFQKCSWNIVPVEKAEDELPPVNGFYPVREGISIVTRRFDGGWYLRDQVFVMDANELLHTEQHT